MIFIDHLYVLNGKPGLHFNCNPILDLSQRFLRSPPCDMIFLHLFIFYDSFCIYTCIMCMYGNVIVNHPERVRQRYTSSHTLLINLRNPGEDFQGGATRFFMDGKSRAPNKTVNVRSVCTNVRFVLDWDRFLVFQFGKHPFSSFIPTNFSPMGHLIPCEQSSFSV